MVIFIYNIVILGFFCFSHVWVKFLIVRVLLMQDDPHTAQSPGAEKTRCALGGLI
jgi:hypothetical protein